MIYKNKGITLVALVITIVILIILATVTINAVLGENGLIKKAEEAKEMAEEATKNEEEGINNLLQEYTNIVGDPTEQEPTKIADVTRNKVFTRTTKISDASGKILYVPGGFGIATDSPNEIDDGIVITNEGNTKQFVWIPVDDESLAEMYNTTGEEKTLTGVTTKTNIYSNLRVRIGDNYTTTTPGDILKDRGIREPDVLSGYDTDEQYYKTILGYTNIGAMADAMVEEYNATYESIQKYDGFYIGRFEITGTVENPTVEKGKDVITNQNWYNLKKACTNVVSSSYAQSTMIYGNQWDEVMNWLIETEEKTDSEVNSDSSSWGNYATDIKRTSGYSESWKANNVYDLAGNCGEWTQEANYRYARIGRGGSFQISMSKNDKASIRNTHGTYHNEYNDLSSRPTLYIK